MFAARSSLLAAPSTVPSIFNASVPATHFGDWLSTPGPAPPPPPPPHAATNKHSGHAQSVRQNAEELGCSCMSGYYAKQTRCLPLSGVRWQNPPNFQHVRTAHHHLYEDRRGACARHLFPAADRASVHQALGDQRRDSRHFAREPHPGGVL